MGVLRVCFAEGIRGGSMGDPQGILGGSSQFLGDPAFLDKQILWVYCIFQGDPAGELAPCIILRVRSTETGAPGKSVLLLGALLLRSSVARSWTTQREGE